MSDGLTNRLGAIILPAYPPSPRSVFRPGGSPISDEALPLLMFGFRMTVDCDVEGAAAAGVAFALGDWTGGYALYAIDGILHFTFRPAGEAITTSSSRTIASGRHSLSVTFAPSEAGGGTFTLECDGEMIGSRTATVTVPPTMQHGGARLCLGHDRGFPVADDYAPPFPWQGVIHEMVVETPPFVTSTGADLPSALHAD
jgi:arylsulfatase